MTDRAGRFRELLDQRIAVLDGAMGTLLQARGLTEKDYRGERFVDHPCELRGNHDLLSLTLPSVVREVHDAYLAAGADVLKTNTFNATTISQADYGTEALAYELNRAGARIAREAADAAATDERPRFVAGVLGPTSRMASTSTDPRDPAARDVEFDDLERAYSEAARGLLDGGVDLFLIETVFDTLNAKAAIHPLETHFEARGFALPVMISVTLHGSSARLISGQTLEAFWCTVAHARPVSVGFNCGQGVAGLREPLRELARVADTRISAHPNAGLPDDLGGYLDTPSMMARHLRDWALEGLLNLVGGCCGAGPAHIRAIADAVRGVSPRVVPSFEPKSVLAGLEPLALGKDGAFVVVGERTSVSGSARFKARIEARDYDSAVDIARSQIKAGAAMLDVNMDAPLLDGQRAMSEFVRTLAGDPAVSRVPLMLDASRWPVLEAGLECVQGKPVINSINLSNGEGELLDRARAIRRYGAALVVSAIDEQGPATTRARKVDVCTRAYRLLTERLGFLPQDIVFDPLVLAVATGMVEHDRYAVDFFDATREIKQTLPHALVCGGVSNVSFAFRGNTAVRTAMHAVFLRHARAAGMDLGIVDPESLVDYEDVPIDLRERAEDAILARRPDAGARLVEVAKTEREGPRAVMSEEAWRTWPVARRLEHALVKGIDAYVESDADEACRTLGGPLAVIEGPLSAGMNAVGDLFAAGKMFLPEIVRSARVMKKAVARLLPLVDAQKLAAPSRKILIATVRGDVHDIGKNIVGTVLGCCGFDVVDLGVRVPAERIALCARSERPALIGLSGLITPSLDEMVQVACALEREGLRVPLLVGGAATSPLHTAVKIAPAYRGLTVWGKDASRAAAVARSIVGEGSAEHAESIRAEQSQMRARHAAREGRARYLPLAEARARKHELDWSGYDYPRPTQLGIRPIEGTLDEIQRYIDWTPFFRTWQLRGRHPDVLRDPEKGEQARRLFDDAREMLARIVGEGWVRARGVIGLFPASTIGHDDVEVYEDETRQRALATFRFLRQQEELDRAYCACLADFVAPKTTGHGDHVGFFALTAGIGLDDVVRRYDAAHDTYRAILVRALCDRLAEAFSEQMHQKVRTELWGYSRGETGDTNALLRGSYRGIRPAMGFPACPDHTEKRPLWNLLDPTRAGIELTETFAMTPASSVCGMYLAHPDARYFAVGRIARDQVIDYAGRKGVSLAMAERWLAPNLGYAPSLVAASGETIRRPERPAPR